MNLKLLMGRRKVQDVKISEKDYSQSKKGMAYKVFRVIDGKLYPPMVANPNGEDTPIGVWLEAEEGAFAGLSKTGRKQVKAIGGKTLSYRPGWHLGDAPRASQFDRSFSWKVVDEPTNLSVVEKSYKKYKTFINDGATLGNVGKIFYVQDIDAYLQIINDNAPYFPYDFVWAECDYIADIDYQEEAMSYGYNKNGNFEHAKAGLPKVPQNGSYRYRTNPRPDTVPWVISGAIKVRRLIDDYEVNEILGGNAPERQGGDVTLEELGLK